ncbi:MAG: hypothetical protein ACLPRE_01015, partial [Limisphaerales bacterium]
FEHLADGLNAGDRLLREREPERDRAHQFTALKHQDDPRYEIALNQELQFIKTDQVNSATGIWLYAVTANGKPADTTLANSWKANYHDVSAMMKFVDAFAAN